MLSPLLSIKRGDKPDDPRSFSKLSRIPRNEDPGLVYIASDLARWEWAFLEARDALGYEDVAVSAILPNHWYAVKKTSIFTRSQRRGGHIMIQKFESIPAGYVLDVRFTLSKHVPPNTDGNGRFTRAPDEVEFDEMLSHIGEHLGMSEFGHAERFGRFEIKKEIIDGKPSATPAGDGGVDSLATGDELDDKDIPR